MKDDGQVKLAFAFGPFHFEPHQRVLMRKDKPLPLGSRAREILLVLLENAGDTVPKRDLISHVWSGTVVEEGTLRVHIAALRKVLGDGEDGPRYVENVTGLGYRFIAPVSRVKRDGLASEQSVMRTPLHPLPTPLMRMLGREKDVSMLAEGLPEKRLTTIVGPGGIGKTTVAVAVAERLRGSYPDGVHYIDLQSISDPGLLCTTIASVLGLVTASADAWPSLVAYTRCKDLLLVLDNCEHLIDAAAVLVESLLAGSPRVNILATSREPLRARGEWLLRLEPLALPEPGTGLTAAEALGFPAIQLFTERARASLHTYELSDDEASVVAEICHRLDGLPLAIELAAARADLFGVRGLARRLDDYLGLLTQGRRTAAPRHQTLRATLDWSYDLLSAAEQQTLRSLAVFAGGFQASCAAAVLDAMSTSELMDVLTQLAAKSLLTVDASGEEVSYRLLNTSRAYALEKLESAADSALIRRRHAQLCRQWAESASSSEEAQISTELLCRRIEDLRAALDWCFSPRGDAVLGLELTAICAPLWFKLSFHAEYRIRVERALALLPELAPGNAALELQLNAALGEALVYTVGAGQKVRAAYGKTVELAEQLGAVQHHWKALWGLYVDRLIAADYQGTVDLALRFQQIPVEPGDLSYVQTGERMMAMSHYLAGDPLTARRHAERMLSRLGPHASADCVPLAHGTIMRGIVPAILWVLGFPQQARDAAREAIERALATSHALGLCYTAAFVAPVLLWTGDVARAKSLVERLDEQAARHSLGYWSCWAMCLQLAAGSREQGIDEACDLGKHPLCTPFQLEVLATVRPELASTEILCRAVRGTAGWCTPELLRIQAERIPRSTPSAAEEAEAGLLEALAVARRQNALSWELRAAMSLARLRREGGRRQDAYAVLQSVLHRFTEGFDTPDLVAAGSLLQELAAGNRVSRAIGLHPLRKPRAALRS